jgi:hypothetical protein
VDEFEWEKEIVMLKCTLIHFPFCKKNIQLELAGWYENPIKSVVTTFPIDKIVFPTITMCPQDSRPDCWGSVIKIFDELNTDCGLQR